VTGTRHEDSAESDGTGADASSAADVADVAPLEAEPEAGSGSIPDAEQPPSDPAPDAAKPSPKEASSKRWWVGLGLVLAVELAVYGSRAEIEVCVGKDGVHDFALHGELREDANRWRFPRCETRMNLGLRSRYDESVEDAASVACRGATLFRNRGEAKDCTEATSGWRREVDARQVWPWDARLHRHLLWFLF
jgi:hypothetical protein